MTLKELKRNLQNIACVQVMVGVTSAFGLCSKHLCIRAKKCLSVLSGKVGATRRCGGAKLGCVPVREHAARSCLSVVTEGALEIEFCSTSWCV